MNEQSKNNAGLTPHVRADVLARIGFDGPLDVETADHPPRILLLYGSLRSGSYSRLVAEECERLLAWYGCETRCYDPAGLPQPDTVDATHAKVAELRERVAWSDGMVWVSPERHCAMTGIMKTQIDWMPLSIGAVRPTQGKTLALLQVSGGSQSFNAVNQMRLLGRWMRMLVIPNQSSVPSAYAEFDDAGRMRASPRYERIVDVMEELVKYTSLVRGRTDYLTDRYSERLKGAAASDVLRDDRPVRR